MKLSAQKFVAGTSALALAITAVSGLAVGSVSASVGYGSNDNVPSGPVSVLRAVNPVNGDHFYTTSHAEKHAAVTSSGYVNEGERFKAYDKTEAGSTAVYRSYNPTNGDHFYTANFAEYAQSIRSNFQIEGLAFHAFAQSGDASTGKPVQPVYRLMHNVKGEHFYTVSTGERDAAKAGAYKDEGVAFYVPVN